MATTRNKPQKTSKIRRGKKALKTKRRKARGRKR